LRLRRAACPLPALIIRLLAPLAAAAWLLGRWGVGNPGRGVSAGQGCRAPGRRRLCGGGGTRRVLETRGRSSRPRRPISGFGAAGGGQRSTASRTRGYIYVYTCYNPQTTAAPPGSCPLLAFSPITNHRRRPDYTTASNHGPNHSARLASAPLAAAPFGGLLLASWLHIITIAVLHIHVRGPPPPSPHGPHAANCHAHSIAKPRLRAPRGDASFATT
jgi:hypothetical protein